MEFLHSTAKYIHLSIQPSAIFINENSDWKLSGFGHIQPVESEEFFIPQYDPRMPTFVNINLNYTAPEVVYENNIYPSSDIYSLGCFIYYLYTKGEKTVVSCDNSTTYYKEDYEKFENRLRQNNPKTVFKNVPETLFQVLPQLLTRYPNQRLSIKEFIESGYFNNPLVKTMIFLDEFPTKSDDEKAIFLKSLVNLLPLFPTTILQKKILPILLDLLGKKVLPLIQITLTIILLIGNTLSQLTFHDKVYLTLYDDKLLSLPEAQIVMLENLSILQQKVKNDEFKKLLLRLTDKVLDLKSNFQIQTKALERTDIMLESIDFPTIKNNIFPKICGIFSKTTSLTVKVKAIDSFVLLIEKKGIDKFTVNETLLPLLRSMKTREVKILEAVLNVYKTSATILDEEQIVEHIIPPLWLLSISSTLNPKSYQDYNNVINDITKTIQTKHMEKLRALEGSKPPADEDDTEKFRHLLYGKEETTQAPAHVGLRDAPLSTTTIQQAMSTPVINNSTPVIKPKLKTEPLTLRPSKPNQKTNLNFGSNSQNVPKAVQNLRATPSLSQDYNDDFDDFVSAPSTRNVTPTLQPTSPPVQTTTLQPQSTIDWSGEQNKIGGFGVLQPSNRSNKSSPGFNNASLSSTINTNGVSNNFPPGFSSQPIQPVRNNSMNRSSSINNNNNNNQKSNYDISLI
ncbi:hypothetical protein BN7_2276 [Wickerhamomyces ciferrii]|uniref:Protein kinase domain-containing protein n=1 Tax=Wickerhamomyces ciferrii (strain ATCC 14091 / BCRC 22168 / CBS 111 / JCM 3599 / NBRC 0793 / NRRL Y-1031 F-60-10) TaxID=1206466 RepID=K0KKQ1_WICCF|nr:uncharacterized protein BN7_2276 [Wickerhamomyces ciferrii]CCH42732.1 hypothetical protein BN7_2276 [Wickerhamomyces ciferrii]